MIPRPVAKATARADAITIDGPIDEAGWNAAQAITEFHQQTPDEGKAYGDFDFGRDRSALFRDRPINVFQIKASYWLGI